jgi:hypothetical protein
MTRFDEIAQGQPGFVAVFGSLQEFLAGVPKVKMGEGKPRARSQMENCHGTQNMRRRRDEM